MYCDKCGEEIQVTDEFCMQCGSKIESKVDVPNTKGKKYHPIKVVAILIAVVLIIGIGAVGYMKTQKQDDDLYADIPWGISLEECEQMAAKLESKDMKLDEQLENLMVRVFDYEGKEGVVAIVTFDCSGGALKAITVGLMAEEGSEYTAEQLRDEYVERFNTQYGKGTKDPYMGTTMWLAEKSRISVAKMSKSVVVIMYQDIKNVLKEIQ